MVHDIALDKASLVSLWVEAILYGPSWASIGIAVYHFLDQFFRSICCTIRPLCVQFKRRSNGVVNKPFLITTILVFVLNTGHNIIGIIRALQALSDEGSSNSAIDYYARSWLPLDIIRQVLMATSALVADIMVAYRCYLVWGCQWKVIVAPVILLVASSVTSFVSVYNFSQLKPGQPFLNSTNVSWGYASFILWLVTIFLITSLIVYRLRLIARQTRELLGNEHGNRYNYIMTIILESGFIYAFSALVLVLLSCMRLAYQAVAFDAISQITGITATLIIVRIGLGTIMTSMPTDEYGSMAAHTSRGRPRRVLMFNTHTSGSGPSESTV